MADVYEAGADGAFDLSAPPKPRRRPVPSAPVRATMASSGNRGMITNVLVVCAAIAYAWDYEYLAYLLAALTLVPRMINNMMAPTMIRTPR